MSKNYVQPGNIVTVTAPYNVASGDGCLVGSLFGVASFTALISVAVEIQTEGVFDIKKTSALAISAGDVLYWDDSAKEVNKTTSGIPVAVAILAAANPSATVRGRLMGAYQPPLDATILRYAVVAITAAQIKAIRATPKTLVATPGANQFLQFVSACLSLDYGSEIFAETGACNLVVRYENTTGAVVSQAIECTGFLYEAADTITNALPKVDGIVAAASGVNKALVLHNSGAAEYSGNATNDSTVSVKIAYRVHTI